MGPASGMIGFRNLHKVIQRRSSPLRSVYWLHVCLGPLPGAQDLLAHGFFSVLPSFLINKLKKFSIVVKKQMKFAILTIFFFKYFIYF